MSTNRPFLLFRCRGRHIDSRINDNRRRSRSRSRCGVRTRLRLRRRVVTRGRRCPVPGRVGLVGWGLSRVAHRHGLWSVPSGRIGSRCAGRRRTPVVVDHGRLLRCCGGSCLLQKSKDVLFESASNKLVFRHSLYEGLQYSEKCSGNQDHRNTA